MAQVWALIPVAFFSEGTAAGTLHRMEVCVLGSTNAYGTQLSAQFFTHVTIVLPDLCVQCAGPSCELHGRPALAHFQQGVLTTEVSHKQVLMTLDKASFS